VGVVFGLPRIPLQEPHPNRFTGEFDTSLATLPLTPCRFASCRCPDRPMRHRTPSAERWPPTTPSALRRSRPCSRIQWVGIIPPVYHALGWPHAPCLRESAISYSRPQRGRPGYRAAVASGTMSTELSHLVRLSLESLHGPGPAVPAELAPSVRRVRIRRWTGAGAPPIRASHFVVSGASPLAKESHTLKVAFVAGGPKIRPC
jgi:hypothetical protein